MKPGLLEKIQGMGHWRVLYRPLRPLPQAMLFKDCATVVEQARVSIRGWDYPHLAKREDDQSGVDRASDYLENWCDWRSQVEFWRMYKSGQFLFYNAVNSDVGADPAPNSRRLDIIDAIYTVAEFVEFGYRLIAQGLYRDGFSLNLSLRNTKGRFLEAGRGRMPFFDYLRAASEEIPIERKISGNLAGADSIETAQGILMELFDAFGWNPEPKQILGDLEAFHRREFR